MPAQFAEFLQNAKEVARHAVLGHHHRRKAAHHIAVVFRPAVIAVKITIGGIPARMPVIALRWRQKVIVILISIAKTRYLASGFLHLLVVQFINP